MNKEVTGMDIIKKLISKEKYSIKCPYSLSPIGITVHNTDNLASAANEIAYMERNDKEISYHFAVDEEVACSNHVIPI